jgi:hypothetical protein
LAYLVVGIFANHASFFLKPQIILEPEISDTTPPTAPSVSAWGNGTLTQLSARATASDSGSAIAAYRYAIGTTIGGTDVVNWTNSATAVITRTGLNLLAGQTYYVSIMARNTAGLWSPVGISNAVSNGSAPVPVAVSLNLASASAGSAGFNLTVSGSNFVPASVVRWNGTDLVTTYVDSGTLSAAVSASLLASVGPASVTVYTPPPGGGTSSGLTFTILPVGVNNPAPSIASLSPSSVTAGSAGFTLTVNGASFVSGSVIRWNSADLATTFISATQLNANISADKVASAGTASVTVFTSSPGGGLSSTLTFTILPIGQNNPLPQLSQLSLTSVTSGAGATLLTLTGANFIPGSVVRWNGTDLTTTYIDSTHLSVTLSASLLVTPGAYTLTVFNSTPGGGESSGLTFTVEPAGSQSFLVYLPLARR